MMEYDYAMATTKKPKQGDDSQTTKVNVRDAPIPILYWYRFELNDTLNRYLKSRICAIISHKKIFFT